MQVENPKGLPENAYRPLKEGEKYIPFVPADKIIPEVTPRSIIWGMVMAFVFTFACAYSGLKAGQVFEAAIPIAILAVGIGNFYKKILKWRENTILENVIIQSIGAGSGVVVAGAIFTLPALFMLNLNPGFLTIFVAAFLGGVFGILFLIPLRRYFVADQHGILPFPEATATTEILVTGESAGNQSKTLILSMLAGGILDFVAETLRFWGVHFNWTMLGSPFKTFTAKTKMLFKMETTTFFIGLGYIVGLRYAFIIVAGSFLSWFVFVPLFGQGFAQSLTSSNITTMGANEIFSNFVRPIGIGAIAIAGLLGIAKNFKVIVSSFSIGFKQIFGHHETHEEVRTDKDISMKTIITLLGVAIIATFVFYYFLTKSFGFGLLTLIITFVITFLFTTVAARAIAIVGSNPVSGMTLVTLIIGSVILVKAGLHGDKGMAVALVMGSVVCTALSVAGGFITDLKIGYWLGATPYNQERFKFLGILIAAGSVGIAIYLLNATLGFTLPNGQPNPALPAPQANVMKSIILTLMDPKANIPWILYGIGGAVAIIMDVLGIPSLAFALGMYLPQELNTPLLVGGFLAWLLGRSSQDEEIAKKRVQKGTLIASGLLAGSALFGVIGAAVRMLPGGTLNGEKINLLQRFWYWMGVAGKEGHHAYLVSSNESIATLIGLTILIVVSILLYKFSLNTEEKGDDL